MKARPTLAFLALLLAGAALAFPQRAETAKSASRAGLAPLEALLPNGLRVGALRGGGLEGEAALSLALRVGSYAERPGQEGYAHLVEHLAFESGQGLAGEAFREALKRRGAFAESNGWTSYYDTIYCFPFDPASEEGRSFVLGLVKGILGAGAYAPESVERAKAIVLREWAEEEGRGELPPEEAEDDEVLGSRKSLAAADSASLAAFSASWYRPELAAVYLVGNIDAEEGLRALKAALSPLPARTEPPDPKILARRSRLGSLEEGWEGPQARVEKDWDGGTLIRLSFPLDARRNREGRAGAVEALALKLLERRLVAGLGRSAASIWRPAVWLDPEALSIEVHAAPGAQAELVAGLGSELLLALRGFKAAELEPALAELRAELEGRLAARRRLGALELARELAERFASEGTPYARPREEELRSALADPRLGAEALGFLRAWLDLERLGFDSPELPKSAEELGRAWASRRARPMKVGAAPALPVLPAPAPPRERWEDPRSGARLLELANGALLGLFPARAGEEELGLWALSPGGYLSAPEADPSLLRLADEVPSFFGIASLPGPAFARELGARGAELWFSLSARHEEIEGGAPAEELEPFLRLLYGALSAPGRPDPAAFSALVSAFDDQADSYDLILGVSSADRYGEGPAFRVLGGKAAQAVDPALLPAAFLDRFGEPADFVWLLSGLPDLDRAESLAAAALGSIPRRGLPEAYPPRPRPLRSGLLDRSGDDLFTDRPSVDFRIEIPLGPLSSPREGLALRTLVEAFRAELYEALREVELAVYSLEVQLWEPQAAGGGNAIYVRFSCAEGAAKRVAERVEEEVRRLSAGLSSARSLDQAIGEARGAYEEGPGPLETWLEALAAEAPGSGGPRRGLAAAGQAIAASYRALEPEALRELARRLVKGEDLFLRVSK